MATNEVLRPAKFLTVVAASVASGDPIVFGQIPGVAVEATQADGNVVMDCSGAIYELLVDGVDNSGSKAVLAGDAIYYNSGATPKLNVDVVTSGHVLFGYAYAAKGATGAPTAGATLVAGNNHTTTIQVKIAVV